MEKRIMGLETEYGAVLKRSDGDWWPTNAANYPIAFLWRKELQKDWRDNELYMSILGKAVFVPNGSILSIDRGHLELSGPECLLARDLVRASRAGDLFLERNFSQEVEDYGRPHFIKDNVAMGLTNGEIAHFGSHENYLFDRTGLASSFFDIRSCSDPALKNFLTYLFSRLLISGGGGISRIEPGFFTLSPRLEFLIKDFLRGESANFSLDACGHYIIQIKSLSGSQEDGYYPLVRLQLAYNDSNISEVAEYLRFGISSLILRLIEDGLFRNLNLRIRYYFRDLAKLLYEDDFTRPIIELDDNTMISPLDALEKFLALAKTHYPRASDNPAVARETLDILERWERILTYFKSNDKKNLARVLDWAMVKNIQTKYLAGEGLDWQDLRRLFLGNSEDSARAKRISDTLFHIEQLYRWVGPKSYWRLLAQKKVVERIISDEEIEKSIILAPGWDEPLARTRSWVRSFIVREGRRKGYFLFPPSTYYTYDKKEYWNKIIVSRELANGSRKEKVIRLKDPFSADLEEAKRVLEELSLD